MTAVLVANQTDGWSKSTVVQPQFQTGTVTIAAGASLSGDIDLGSSRLFGLIVPNGWTAADLTFQGSIDDATWFEVYDQSGAEVTVTVAVTTGELVLLNDPGQWLGIRYLKIRSGTQASAVAQASAAAITMIAVP